MDPGEKRAARQKFWTRMAIVTGVITVIAPLFGVLGTVSGMVGAFDTMGMEGGADPSQLAEGVSRSLVTTAVGIVISIVSVILCLFSVVFLLKNKFPA